MYEIDISRLKQFKTNMYVVHFQVFVLEKFKGIRSYKNHGTSDSTFHILTSFNL